MKSPWNTSYFKLAGPVDRLIIFLGSLSLGSFISHCLLSFKYFESLESSFAEFFSPAANILGFPAGAISYFPMVFLVSEAITFFSTLILGRSLFEMIAGVKNSGPWWWRRIGGAAKSMIDIFTGMLVVFDLPIFLKRSTLKEHLTGSYTLVSTKGASLRCLLILPIFFILILFAPLMTNLGGVRGSAVSQIKVDEKKLGHSENFSDFEEIKSEYFHFKSFTSMDKGKLWPLPDYDRIRERKRKRISPLLVIYDSNNKTTGHWRIKKQISLLKLLSLGRRGNPLFSIHFPHLNAAIELILENPDAFSKKEGASVERFDDLFTTSLKEDIARFLKASFELRAGQVLEHALTYGPFMRGFLEVREALVELLPKGSRAEVDLIELGDHNFLRFRQKHENDSIVSKSYTENYLPIATEHSSLFEMGWDSDLSGALGAKSFRENVLSRAKWLFDYKNIFKNNVQEQLREITKASALAILDLLVERELSSKDQGILEKLMYRFYFDTCRKAISEKDADLIVMIKDNMERLSSFIEYKNKLNAQESMLPFSNIFLDKWKTLGRNFLLDQEVFFRDENSRLFRED